MWVHAVVEKADGVFFRCTLDGTETDRFLEIPAWMFDRAWCSQCHVTRDPFVRLALKPDAHEGYVSWERFEAIRTMVSGNVPSGRHHGLINRIARQS